MLKRYTNNIDFDLYRNAADKLGIAFVPILEETEPLGYFSIGRTRLYIQRNKLGVNNNISSAIARNKYRTNQILTKFKLPSPRTIFINGDDTMDRVVKAVQHLHRPLVVKPLRGSHGRGISVKVDGRTEIAKAIRFAKKTCKTVLIEEFVEGTNYRVYVFGNEIIDIVERIPAYVTGDGKSSIRQLIDAKGDKRSKAGLKPIRIDQELDRVVKGQNYAMTSVPGDGTKVFLRLNCNLASGGETKRLDLKRDVHPDNLQMFVAATREIGLTLAGIDFITPDISRSYKDVRCGINEINRAPSLDAHYFADFALNNRVGERILAKLQSRAMNRTR